MNKKLILSLICVGIISFLSVLIETSLNVTFTKLSEVYGIDISTASLLTSVFLLAISMMMPLSSFIVANFNTRKVFLYCCILFMMSIFICAFSWHFEILVFARFVQGIVAGITLPLMFNMVLIKSTKEYLGFLIGFCVFLVGTAPGLGPIYGGYMLEFASFKYIFLALIPFILLALILGFFSIENLQGLEVKKFDFIEYILILLFIISLFFSVKKPMFLFAPVILLFVLSKKSEIFKSALNIRFLAGSFVTFFIMFSLLSFSLLLPNYLINVLSLNYYNASFSLLTGSMIAAILAPFSGYLSDKFGSFKISFLGIIFMALACKLFLIYDKNLYNFMIFYTVYALGQGFCMSSLIAYVLKNSSHKTNANAFLNTFQQCSGTLGVMITSMIFNNDYIVGFSNAMSVLFYLNSLSLVLVLVAFFGKKNA